MVSTKKDPTLAVVFLSGGNDVLNTLIPFNDPNYHDRRPNVRVPEDQMVPFTDDLAFHPAFAPMKKFWDEGKMAIILGTGYPHGTMSHFRSADIWATCEPVELLMDGWLGRAIQALDPNVENVLTGVNFGRGLPRAMAKEGVPVASVGDLSMYGLMTDFEKEEERKEALDLFGRMYAPRVGTGAVDGFIRSLGTAALQGADILATAPSKYQSDVEYEVGNVGEYLKDMVQVHNAGFGTKIMFTQSPYNQWDTHANQLGANLLARGHGALLANQANNTDAFITDLRNLDISDNVTTLIYSEFGRRAQDNGSGTDHGAGGAAFVIGEHVKGGIYGEYPSLKMDELDDDGNLAWAIDFRSIYTTLLERWLGLDAKPIVGGAYEQLNFL